MHRFSMHAHPALQPGRVQVLGAHHHEFAPLYVLLTSPLFVSVRPQIFASKQFLVTCGLQIASKLQSFNVIICRVIL